MRKSTTVGVNMEGGPLPTAHEDRVGTQEQGLRQHPALEHRTRKLLHTLIHEHAGACETDLGRLTDLGRNTVKYHLQRLVRANLVRAIKEGRKIHYFPNKMGLVRLQRAIVANQKPMQRRILKLMRERPDLSWRAMGRILDVTPRTIRWHVEQLQRQGLVMVMSEGQRHEVQLDAAVEQVLQGGVGRASTSSSPHLVLSRRGERDNEGTLSPQLNIQLRS